MRFLRLLYTLIGGVLLYGPDACATAQDYVIMALADSGVPRQVYAEVNGKLGSMGIKTFMSHRPDDGYASKVKQWSDRSGVRKLEVTEPDDSGDVVGEYYFANGELVFYFGTIKGYDSNGRQVARIEQRQYFHDGRMFKWLSGIGANMGSTALTNPEFRQEEQLRLAAAAFYLRAGKSSSAIAAESTTGNEIRRRQGTVIRLDMGDVACYLTLRDSTGKETTELADFDLCTQNADLSGKKVELGFSMIRVMDDSCGGNPDCKRTRQASVATSIKILGDRMERKAIETHVQERSFCTPTEATVFSCRSGTKLISVCSDPSSGPKQGYLQYRFGKPDSREPLEINWPESLIPAAVAATGGTEAFSGGGAAWLRIRKADYAYVVFTGIGRWGPNATTKVKEGVVVEHKGKVIAVLNCSHPAISKLGAEWFSTVRIEPRGETFDMPD